jgi:PAS domain S-box-containing protein
MNGLVGLTGAQRLDLADQVQPPYGMPLSHTTVLSALQVAVYTTDAGGRITFYNRAAAELWGVEPEIGKSEFCGSWRMRWPDGTPLPHDQCPMAIALREKRAIAGAEAVAVRPDGTLVPFLAYPAPLFDGEGKLVGAVNILIDISNRERKEHAARLFEAIVESSDDAIVSKDLNGVIASWNAGAERLFGYSADEAVGQPILMLIPEERHSEETEILSRIRRGERIEHYETVRRRKDGRLIDVSLTVSPVKDGTGRVIGASKIARDITERRRAGERQRLMLREMNHRVKNLLTLAGSIVTISGRHADTSEELVRSVRDRLSALGRAHTLTLPDPSLGGEAVDASTTLKALLETIVEPYVEGVRDGRIRLDGPEIVVGGQAVTGLALLLHEFATNAAKYGALSSAKGQLAVNWSDENGAVTLVWRESGGPRVPGEPENSGFGSMLTNATVTQFGGKLSREWLPEGLVVELSLPLERLSG